MPFYTNHNTGVIVSPEQANETHFWLWAQYVDGHTEYEDIEQHCALVTANNGTTRYHASFMITSLIQLQELPLTCQWYLENFSIPLDHLLTGVSVFLTLNPTQLTLADQAFVNYLTPTVDHQQVPTKRRIKKQAENILTNILGITQVQQQTHEKTITIRDNNLGMSSIYIETDAIIGEALRTVVGICSRKHDCTQVEAFNRFITGEARMNVTLNLYNTPDGPALPGYGLVDPNTITNPVPKQATPDKEAQSYSTPDWMKSLMDFRDQGCRGTLRNHNLHNVERDHTLNYKEGGPTHLSNLLTLCKKCHRLKGARK